MRLSIEIPKEFEKHFNNNRFKDSFERICADMQHCDCTLSGLYDLELIQMLQNAISKSILGTGKPKWHKIFKGKSPSHEYWDLPQDRLPRIENFYFVKLKNGFIKICELKYTTWSRKKCFYDLHGRKQSNVAEWLEYPVCDKE